MTALSTRGKGPIIIRENNMTELKNEFYAIFGNNLWRSDKPKKPYKDQPYIYYGCGDKVWDWIEKHFNSKE